MAYLSRSVNRSISSVLWTISCIISCLLVLSASVWHYWITNRHLERHEESYTEYTLKHV